MIINITGICSDCGLPMRGDCGDPYHFIDIPGVGSETWTKCKSEDLMLVALREIRKAIYEVKVKK